MTKIVFLDRGTFAPSVELTKPGFPHDWEEYDQTLADQIVERAGGAEIVVTNKVPLRRDTLADLPDLKMIAVAATGFDVIDLEACKERGIVVSNVRGYAMTTVPEHTFALIMALRRGIAAYRQEVAEGVWRKSGQFCFHTHPINDLRGATLGIMGEGAIGQSVARLGQAFGMETIFAAHKGVSGLGPLYTPFEEVLERSDVITLHCPLMPATRNMLGLSEFRQMKRRPLIINTARGGLVDEAALITALDEGLIAGAGFDCLTVEPPPDDHPMIAALDRPNLIVTPHVAWASQEAMQTCWNQVVEHIENYNRGEPSNTLT